MSTHPNDSIEKILETLRAEHNVLISPHFFDKGGQCFVYKGHFAGHECAIRISKRPSRDDRALSEKARWARELELFGNPHARHSGIVSMLEQQLADPMVCGHIVTFWEFCEGGSLRERLDASPNGLSATESLGFFEDVAPALDELKDRGIYHRDVKPDNILISRGRAKLADFGLAKFAGGSTTLHTGGGTHAYMPLEMLRPSRSISQDNGRLPVSPTVDVFGLAATYYELRTGIMPFGNEVAEVMERQDRQEIELSPLETWEREVVRAALSKYPAERWQSAGEFVRRLRATALASASGPIETPQEIVAKAAQIHLSKEQTDRQRAEEAELARQEALKAAAGHRHEHLRNTAVVYLQASRWEPLYSTSCQILEQWPEDAEAKHWREIALEKCIPSDLFDHVCQILRQGRDAILQQRRLTSRGWFAMAGGCICLLSFIIAVVVAWRAIIGFRAMALSILVAPILAFGLLMIILTPASRGPRPGIKIFGWLAVVAILVWMTYQLTATTLPLLSLAFLVAIGLLWLTGIVLLADRATEPWIDAPSIRASRRRRAAIVTELETVHGFDLDDGRLSSLLMERDWELAAFYHDVWPNRETKP